MMLSRTAKAQIIVRVSIPTPCLEQPQQLAKDCIVNISEDEQFFWAICSRV